MNREAISKDAYARWEAEGRPDGQLERHWSEAEAAATNLAQTSSPNHNAGVSPPSKPPKQKGKRTKASSPNAPVAEGSPA